MHEPGVAASSVFEPLEIGSMRLPHRIAMGAMHLGGEADPDAGPRLARFYAERARGGAGLICTGGWAVSADGAGDGSYGIVGERSLGVLAEIAAAGAGSEARIALQLFHAGRYASADGPGGVVAPSAVPSSLTRATPRALGEDEVWSVVEEFATAAARARELGFAAVELMGSEGYLVDQFLSPRTNLRDDGWGGDPARRMRFGLELAGAVRAAVGPEFPIIFRMTGAELVSPARPWPEVTELASGLAAAGVDALNVGVGWHESRVPTVQGPVPPGVWLPWAESLKLAVGEGAVVIAGNRVNRIEQARALLDSSPVEMISMSRPFLADPDLIDKARAGAALNVCIACNQACIDRSLRGGRVSCMVNPRAGSEAVEEPRAAPGSRFAVIGGGPAGMEAARALASMGAAVELFEAEDELGGQFRLARLVPGKEDYGATIAFFERELARLGVEVQLGREVGEGDAALLGEFDGVVLASGVRPRRIDLPGADGDHVFDYPAAFAGAVEGRRRVAILGAGGIGVDLAHLLSGDRRPPAAPRFLAEFGLSPPSRPAPALKPDGAGRQVTLMRRRGRLGAGIGPTTRWVWLDALRRAGVRTLTGLEYRRIGEDGVEIVPEEGEPEVVAADAVVIAAGQEPHDPLRPVLEELGRPFRAVGGAADARDLNAVRAFAQGLEAARELARRGRDRVGR
ncbi:MAG: FAD-dependent oxidoreductase [Solirubrobacterales bacterium]